MNQQNFATLPASASGDFQPFKLHTPDSDLQVLQSLIKSSRIGPKTYENTRPDRLLGITQEWLAGAIHHWQTSFDWRKHEDLVNSFPAYLAKVRDDDGRDYQIHFVALFSTRKDAIPVLLFHGWPGSFLEFLPILGRVRAQYSPEDSPYHLVVPSLPGYAFSSPPPTDKDLGLSDMARLFDKLAKRLGFTAYVTQGGDLGSKVARVIAAEHEACKAVHINFCIMPEPKSVRTAISDAEQVGLQRAREFHRIGSAYAVEHATKPSTIGFAVGSNPVSLLAWVGEKFLDWTDEDPPFEVILESVSLYWLTDTFSTSIYPYRHLFTPGIVGAHEDPKWYINKPMGFSWFPKELAPIPRAWVETTGNLVFHREHEKGGHFAAVERPDDLWRDVEEFIRQVWGKEL